MCAPRQNSPRTDAAAPPENRRGAPPVPRPRAPFIEENNTWLRPRRGGLARPLRAAPARRGLRDPVDLPAAGDRPQGWGRDRTLRERHAVGRCAAGDRPRRDHPAAGLPALPPALLAPRRRLAVGALRLGEHRDLRGGCGGAGRTRHRGGRPPRPARRPDGGAGADRRHADRALGREVGRRQFDRGRAGAPARWCTRSSPTRAWCCSAAAS